LALGVSLRSVARDDPSGVWREHFLEVGLDHRHDGVSSVEQAHSAICSASPLALTAHPKPTSEQRVSRGSEVMKGGD
jgi:hypothetical protein